MSEPVLHIRDGREIWLAVSIVVIRDRPGNAEAVVLEIFDRTEEMTNVRLTELQGAELLRSLELRTASLLHEISNPVGTAYVAASHSLSELGALERHVRSTPSVIEGPAGMLLTEQRESQELVVDNLRQAAELMREFKTLAADQATMDSERTSLVRILDTIVRSTAPLLRRARVAMDVRTEGLDNVEVATGPMMQVLNNLVINAVRHGLDGVSQGRVRIHARRNGGEVLISVADNGCGMTEVVKERLFEPYFTTASDRGGTGLGLHIVLEIVKRRFNGTISVVSSPGEGAEFRLSLPVDPSPTS